MTWKYVPADSTATEARYFPEGTIAFEPYAASSCYTITPSTYTLTQADYSTFGSLIFLIVDYAISPPAYRGSAATIWAATYTDTCHGGSSQAGAGGAWFQAQGNVSVDGTMITGIQTASGQTFTFSFAQQ